jgi:ankyrin repeat protein
MLDNRLRIEHKKLTTIIQLHIQPLHVAVAFDMIELASLLIEKGADVNAQDCFKRDALMYACRRGCSPEMVALLLQKGAKPYRADAVSCSCAFAIEVHPKLTNIVCDLQKNKTCLHHLAAKRKNASVRCEIAEVLFCRIKNPKIDRMAINRVDKVC